MRTRSSNSDNNRSPTPEPAPAVSGRRVRRGTPYAPPQVAGARARGLMLSPVAERRPRGGIGMLSPPYTLSAFLIRVPPSVRASPRPLLAGHPLASASGSVATAPAGPRATLAYAATSASAPRPASEGPFALPALAMPAGPKIELLDDAANGALVDGPIGLSGTSAHASPLTAPGAAPAGPLPDGDRAVRDAGPATRAAPAARADPPRAVPGLLAPELDPSLPDGAGYADPPSPPQTAAAAAVHDEGPLAFVDDVAPSSPGDAFLTAHQGASPAVPSADELDPPVDELRGDDGARGTSPASELSYFDPGEEPAPPPRRNALVEPRAAIFSTGVAAQAEAIQRALPLRLGLAPGAAGMFTPKPKDGFPVPHDALPDAKIRNIRGDQLRAWDLFDGPKAFLQFGGHGALDDEVGENLGMVAAALAALHTFLGSTTATIALPHPITRPGRPNQAPYTALIRDITDNDLARVLDHPVLASTRGTLIVSQYGVGMPTLLGSLTKLRSTNVDDIYLLVRARLDDLVDLIMTKAYENPAVVNAVSLHGFADDILSSLLVKYLPMRDSEGDLDPHFYIYASLPLTNFASFREIQVELVHADWTHPFAGKGTFTILEEPDCTFCHGADHPRGLCPLPQLPGWIAPAPRAAARGPANNKRRAGDQGRGDRYKFSRHY
ncbi:hypothetical protein EIP86_006822 [Pleurotus ostreatoroseus]|nr:hypothetical protein EIP86_006822 [Pleurotus ostreatoroseus]